MLLSQIEDLEKEIEALIPAWEVPGLKLSYLNSEVLSARCCGALTARRGGPGRSRPGSPRATSIQPSIPSRRATSAPPYC